MKTLRTLPVAAILATAVALPAAAQQPTRVEITPLAGAVLFPTDLPTSFALTATDGTALRLDGAEFDAAPAFGLAAGIRPSGLLAFEVGGTFAPGQVTAATSGQSITTDLNLFLVHGGVRLYAPRLTPWLEAYAAGGAGAKIYDYDLAGVDAETDVSVNFGGGLDVRLAPPLRLRLDARDHVSWLDPAVGAADTEVQHDLLLTAGLSLQIPLGGRRR